MPPLLADPEHGTRIDLDSIREQTFLGYRLTQSWADLAIWEYVLGEHPELRTIIEIGTWEGGMSRFLFYQAQERRMNFVTFDLVAPSPIPMGFVQMDVFEEADTVRGIIAGSEHPLLLLCDGGDKPREMREYAPGLLPGDLLAVHDWEDEAGPEDVPDCLDGVYGTLCAGMTSHTRFFERSPR